MISKTVAKKDVSKPGDLRTRTIVRKAPASEVPNRLFEELSQMSDEDLMSQFQAGVVEAFDILVGRYKDPLTNYIYRFLGDMKECGDL
ncbi:MAG: hypothetical protein ACC655_05315, partial [Rhodothermia bacterium]